VQWRKIKTIMDLRGLFILLCLNLTFEDDILIRLNGMIKTVRELPEELR
jgi:hypothetical protein